jgi:hypothetical protein
MSLSDKVKALRQVQFVLGESRRATPRSCGLTEDEFPILANEELLGLTIVQDPGEAPDLDRFHIVSISPKGMAILAKAHVAEPDPVKIDIVPREKPIWLRIYDATRSGLWDLIKLAFGAICGGLVTWYILNHKK